MVRRNAIIAALFGIFLFVLVPPIRAEEAITPEDADACTPDVHRLCDAVFPDEKLVAACLVDKRMQLSVACAEALARPRSSTLDESNKGDSK